ncbi:hypothetical protein [Photobacterium angustum]|uniref:Uncharacterized protein n=1 Tax=Photobacterium angustum (strain S14 / CCUG 15956) TaxID=314292 RepID=Q1ZV27_PHOAS|nr:hypothetical protein [Photobacterium angustum]EAS66233.1 hypothetical protein VAS14_12989 [Photobacterium angustum S14]
MKSTKNNAIDKELFITALNECYRRLNETGLTVKDLSKEGFTLLFQSAYKAVTAR